MAKFTYNKTKNTSTSYMTFKLNYDYYLWMLYKDNIDPRSQSKIANKLSAELKELMILCRENLYHAQKFQKQAHNKGVKPRSYGPNNKVWLNSKYIKNKQNQKLEAKFFVPFCVLHLVSK